MDALTGTYGGWHLYWALWFCLSFFSFLAVEIYALLTDWQRTLSAAVWHLEGFVPGQRVIDWSAFHFLFIGVLGVLFVWLFFHFGMGLFR